MTARRDRTAAEIDDYMYAVMELFDEQFSFLAWNGFQQHGRGVVFVVEEHGAVFCAREHIHTLPIYDQLGVLQIVDNYNPETEVAIVMVLPETPQVYETVRMFLYRPLIVPPKAKADSMLIVRGKEARH